MKELTTRIARSGRTARLWVVGAVAAALVAAGGGYAAASLTGNTTPATAGTATAGTAGTGTAGTLTAQAAELNAALSPAAARNTAHARRVLARLRLLPGMYGQFSVHTRKHGTVTLAYERGMVTATGGAVTVRAAGGAEWTWHFTSHTVVRESGAKAGTGDLSSGERVFVGGTLTGSTRYARLIIIRPGKRGSTPHAAPSASASAGSSTAG